MKRFINTSSVIIILLLLAFISSAPSFAEEYKNYDFSGDGLSVSFPVTWKVERNSQGVIGIADGYFARAGINHEPKGKKNLDTFFNKFRKTTVKAYFRDFREGRVGDATVGGYKAKYLGFSSNDAGMNLKGFYYFVDVKNKRYVILLAANGSTYGQASSRFEKILKSIKFK